ncbi:MAG: outer membrane protein assembly factor BamD [Chitinophagaceae bacterium]|nr:outer membrane protein assembly factor BamD [Chitinophagaceae bacterium]HMN32724.1 outer membrane protein assembly factor BamD [Chitinophagaceae bacterium]
MKKLPILFLMILFIASACNSGFEKILKSKDFAFKLQKANEYYDKKQFGKANTLYEELLTVYKGTKNFESIYYKYAYTFYNQKQYLAASYHFKNFSDLFPKSDKSEECEYLNSLCLYYMSPDYTLDQSNTIKSIGEMQTYINTHPNSKKLKEANKMIDNLRNKLEEKDNYGAALYYKISEFKAASVAYEQIIRKYPDSKNVEYYYFRVIDSKYKYAKSSIPSKQEERLNDVSSYYKEFVRKYPKSPYRSDVEKINTLSLQTLKKLSKS